MKLYHYVHCPFCIRVRMGFGLLKIKYDSIVVSFDDEKTPIDLTGVKMLPIIVKNNSAKNESLEILKSEDHSNTLQWEFFEKQKTEIESLIVKIASPVHSLCMPYWIWTPEFNEQSRMYFQTKKEIKRGPFKNLIHDKDQFIKTLNEILIKDVEPHLNSFYKSSTISIIDIMIAAHLWGMYIFPEFQFSDKIHHYLQSIKNHCAFNYHEDFWK